MKLLLPCLLLFGLMLVPADVLAQRQLGPVEIAVAGDTIPVRVSGSTAEINSLALQAFGVHGRYRLVASGYTFDIRFTQSGPAQVQVAITRAGESTPASTDTVDGRSLRNALLRAADVAVERTNGLGLKGFFASKLAFIQNLGKAKEVCTSDLFFGEVVRQTNDGALALTPRWSPDGGRIIYTSYFRSGFPDIYVINLASRQRTTFASIEGTNLSARYSPNGNMVAMVLTGEGRPEIYLSNAEGRGITRLTRSDAVKSSPVFSPDGTRVLFVSEQPGGGGNPQLYVIPVTGGSARRITSGISVNITEPDWSRTDPNKIAFTMAVGKNFQIGVLDLSTNKGGQVSNAPFDAVEASWLPDGRHLVYTARSRTDSRICILDSVTGKSTTISPSSLGSVMEASVWSQ